MAEKKYQPDSTRVSILTSMVLLAFALSHLISTPSYSLTFPIAGMVISLAFNLNTLIVLLAGGLTATGMNWLLDTHPSLEKGETREHWLLPTLTVLVIGVVLYTLPPTLIWWLGFGMGATILLVVFYAEFTAVDPSDTRYPFATAILTVFAFIIFLILAMALKASNARLFLVAPALFVAGGLVALRTLHLRLSEHWEAAWAIGIAVVTVQLGAALYYMPLTPVRFGLGLLGPIYCLTSLSINLLDGSPLRQAIIEPAAMLILICSLMIWFH
jgi:hypothetical protein